MWRNGIGEAIEINGEVINDKIKTFGCRRMRILYKHKYQSKKKNIFEREMCRNNGRCNILWKKKILVPIDGVCHYAGSYTFGVIAHEAKCTENHARDKRIQFKSDQ
jgi:hypothetical protein